VKNKFSFWKFFKLNGLKIYFSLSLIIVGFAYGFIASENKLPPYEILIDAKSSFEDWKKNWKAYSIVPQQKLLIKSAGSDDGVTVNISVKTWSGVTFLTGTVDESLGIQMIDMDGTVLHQWKVSFNKIWPNATHLDKQPKDFYQEINGAKFYKNGDIIFNFTHMAIVKIDRCSNVIWKGPYRAHHSVYEDKDGNIWFPSLKKLKKPYPFLRQIKIDEPDFIFKASSEGKLLRQINLLEVIKRSNMTADFLSTGKNFLGVKSTGNDYTHMNNVKILEGPKAKNFSLFKEGDIMVSIRNFNTIIIIDPDTELVKWSMTGPFVRQHDPDFLEDGHISVIDNMGGEITGDGFGISQILRIDPVNKTTKVIYKGDEKNPFSTRYRGNHQHLPNGNILITESHSGRLFEVDKDGEVVWSYTDRWDEKQTVIIYQAERFPKEYADFAQKPCL
jgi:hypothetical protein